MPVTRPDDILAIVGSRSHVLLDFDGPVCSIFAGISAPVIAQIYRAELARVQVELSAQAQQTDDPLEVFRQVADLGPDQAETGQAILTKLETHAAGTARPTPGATELITAAQATGRTLTIVSNNSGAAIAAYLDDHQLTQYVTAIVGRDDAAPRLMKPSPYRVRIAVAQLDATPGDAFLVGDSPSDVLAGRLAGVAVIGYANKLGKDALLTQAGADAVTSQLSEISAALQASKPTPSRHAL